MTRNELIRIAKRRHPGDNWVTAFAAEIGVSYWTVYRLANNEQANVSELVKLKVEKALAGEGGRMTAPDTVPFDDFLHGLLADPEQLESYLSVALEEFAQDRDLDALLQAVTTARDAMRKHRAAGKGAS